MTVGGIAVIDCVQLSRRMLQALENKVSISLSEDPVVKYQSAITKHEKVQSTTASKNLK